MCAIWFGGIAVVRNPFRRKRRPLTVEERRALPPLERWRDATDGLRSRVNVPPALANAWLLDQARAKWGTVVVAHSSMHDLIFSRQGDKWPWPVVVRVSWSEGVYEFNLLVDTGILVSADRCLAPNASVVLDSFLYQLAGQLTPDAPIPG